MLLETLGELEMFSGRVFPRCRTALIFKKTESNRDEQSFPRYGVCGFKKYEEIVLPSKVFLVTENKIKQEKNF